MSRYDEIYALCLIELITNFIRFSKNPEFSGPFNFDLDFPLIYRDLIKNTSCVIIEVNLRLT